MTRLMQKFTIMIYRNSKFLIILPMKTWKKLASKVRYCSKIAEFSVLPKWPNLPENKKVHYSFEFLYHLVYKTMCLTRKRILPQWFDAKTWNIGCTVEPTFFMPKRWFGTKRKRKSRWRYSFGPFFHWWCPTVAWHNVAKSFVKSHFYFL